CGGSRSPGAGARFGGARACRARSARRREPAERGRRAGAGGALLVSRRAARPHRAKDGATARRRGGLRHRQRAARSLAGPAARAQRRTTCLQRHNRALSLSRERSTMATVVCDNPYHDRRVAERRRIAYPAMLRADGMRVSWGCVFGGVLVALGFLLLMTALGVAVGISAAQPGETDTATLGTGAGIWAGISLLAALFIGGWVSTRIGAIFDGTTGFFGGALVWIVSVLMMVYFASSGIGMLAGGAFKLVGGAAQALGSVVQSQGAPDVSGNVDQIIQRLKDPKTAQQIASATGMPPSE